MGMVQLTSLSCNCNGQFMPDISSFFFDTLVDVNGGLPFTPRYKFLLTKWNTTYLSLFV